MRKGVHVFHFLDALDQTALTSKNHHDWFPTEKQVMRQPVTGTSTSLELPPGAVNPVVGMS